MDKNLIDLMVLDVFLVWAQSFIVDFSYIAVFIVSAVSTSTIFIPIPFYLVIALAAGFGLSPLLVGIVSGLGAAVGELTGYLIGLGSRNVIEQKRKKEPKFVILFTKLFKKYGFAVILFTSFLPFPFDFIGILSGVSNYDIKKFYIAVAIGKVAKSVLIAYAGYFGVPAIEEFIVWLKTVV